MTGFSKDRRPGEFTFIFPTGKIGEGNPHFTVESEVFPIGARFDWDVGAICVAGTQGGFPLVRPEDHKAAIAEWRRRFPGTALPTRFTDLYQLRNDPEDHRWGLALTTEEQGVKFYRTMAALRSRTAALRL